MKYYFEATDYQQALEELEDIFSDYLGNNDADNGFDEYDIDNAKYDEDCTYLNEDYYEETTNNNEEVGAL